MSIWHIIAISFFSALAFSFEVPCRQALISDIVDEKDVVSAVGLNSLAFNIAAVNVPTVLFAAGALTAAANLFIAVRAARLRELE